MYRKWIYEKKWMKNMKLICNKWRWKICRRLWRRQETDQWMWGIDSNLHKQKKIWMARKQKYEDGIWIWNEKKAGRNEQNEEDIYEPKWPSWNNIWEEKWRETIWNEEDRGRNIEGMNGVRNMTLENGNEKWNNINNEEESINDNDRQIRLINHDINERQKERSTRRDSSNHNGIKL